MDSFQPRFDHPRRSFRRALHAGVRGFTLVELMTALTGSLFFTIFVFMLSRDVSRFFTEQVRTSDTMLRTLSGFERLRNDIVRAGFLASPNITRDVNRCPRPVPGTAAAIPEQVGTQWTSEGLDGLQQMALLRIETTTNTAVLNNYMIQNNAGASGLQPEVLTLYGNYTSAEQFPVRTVQFGGANTQIIFEVDSPAMARVGITPTTDVAIASAILQSIFRPGQIIRIVDETGREQFGLVDQSTLPGMFGTPAAPVVALDPSVNLVRKQGPAGTLCGIRGAAAGLSANPVDIVRYELVDVAADLSNHPHLQFLYGGATLPYDNTRLDLMRYRVPPTVGEGDPVPAADRVNGELIAEYATDLRFGLTVLSNAATGVINHLPEGDSDLGNYADRPTDTNTAGRLIPPALDQTYGPQFIRGVHARLNVRYRQADRTDAVLNNPGTAAAEDLFRVQLDAAGNFARTRTLRSHIATRNTQNLMWN